MALLAHASAMESWSALVHTVSLMVDYVQFVTVQHYNSLLRPMVHDVISTTRGLRSSSDSPQDIAEEFNRLLYGLGWDGDRFVRAGNAIALLATLKGFKLVWERFLGSGAYSQVTLSRSELTGEKIVMKHVPLETDEHGIPVHGLRELALLKTLRHPHILRLYDALFNENEVVLMLEYMDCSLQYLLQCRGALPLCNVKSYTHQVLQALKYTKSKRVMHRDLKPANILVNLEEGVVKLADFGLSRLHEQGGRYSRQVMTLKYRAPEVMLGIAAYDETVDLWSVGCMLAEMSTGVALFSSTPTFSGPHEIVQLLKVFDTLGTPTLQEWPEQAGGTDFTILFPQWPKPPSLQHLAPGLDADGVALLTSLLEFNPACRITAHEALQHPWFHDVVLPNPSQ